MHDHAPASSASAFPAESEGSEPGEQTRRRTVVTIIVAALLATGVWLLIGQATSYSKLIGAIERAQPWWLAIAAGAAVLGYLGYAVPYQAVAGILDGPRPAVRLTLRITMAVFGASVIATAAGRLGSEYWSLRRMGERPARTWSQVRAINTAAWAILAALAFGGALALVGALDRRRSAPSLPGCSRSPCAPYRRCISAPPPGATSPRTAAAPCGERSPQPCAW